MNERWQTHDLCHQIDVKERHLITFIHFRPGGVHPLFLDELVGEGVMLAEGVAPFGVRGRGGEVKYRAMKEVRTAMAETRMRVVEQQERDARPGLPCHLVPSHRAKPPFKTRFVTFSSSRFLSKDRVEDEHGFQYILQCLP